MPDPSRPDMSIYFAIVFVAIGLIGAAVTLFLLKADNSQDDGFGGTGVDTLPAGGGNDTLQGGPGGEILMPEHNWGFFED